MGLSTEKVIGYREVATLSFWRDCLAEGVATFIFNSIQAALPLTWGNEGGFPQAILVGLGMGFVLAILAESLGPFGGVHVNPAVSVSMFACMKISLLRAVIYIGVQCAAAIGGAGFIYLVTPAGNRESLGATTVNPNMDLWQGVLVEAWLTAILLLAIFGSTNARRNSVFVPGLFIGLALALDIMTGIRYTGGSMNPARSLAPAVIMNKPEIWSHQWVYWVGPICGGLIMTLIYNLLLDRVKRPKDEKSDKDLTMEDVRNDRL